MSQYIFEHEGVKYYFKKDESDKDKCIVFACAKNEDEYMKRRILAMVCAVAMAFTSIGVMAPMETVAHIDIIMLG